MPVPTPRRSESFESLWDFSQNLIHGEDPAKSKFMQNISIAILKQPRHLSFERFSQLIENKFKSAGNEKYGENFGSYSHLQPIKYPWQEINLIIQDYAKEVSIGNHRPIGKKRIWFFFFDVTWSFYWPYLSSNLKRFEENKFEAIFFFLQNTELLRTDNSYSIILNEINDFPDYSSEWQISNFDNLINRRKEMIK